MLSTKSLPSITIVVPTYNEETNIKTCLDSIFSQDYPFSLIEIVVVDNRSTDRTIEIVNDYAKKHKNTSIIFNDIAKDAEISKMLGLRKATRDLFLYLDADIEVIGQNSLSKLVMPLVECPTLVGSFPRFVPKPTDVALGRYLRYHPLELDPVFQFFCTEISKTIVADKGHYKVCEFHPEKIPPIGICIYKRDILAELSGHAGKFMDIDIPVMLSENGYNKFAYVPKCEVYHTNVRNLCELLDRRSRNIHRIYIPSVISRKRKFTYLNLRSRKDFLRAFAWIFYANSMIMPLFRGIWKAVKNKDIACMYEPIVTMILTDWILYNFLKSEGGRELITSCILHFLGIE